MKNILKTILYSAITLSFSACSLDEFPLNGPSTGTFPSSGEEAEAGVLGAYKAISNMVIKYQPFPSRYLDMLTDVGSIRRALDGYDDFKASVQTSEHAVVSMAYSRIYKVAGRVHLVLDNLDRLLENKSVSYDEYCCYKAELLLIRAYVYDIGCQLFGDIPFIDHSLDLTDYKYARMPRAKVTEKLMTDLDDELLNHLPVQWDKALWGTARIGRAAAYTLKARIALNWGMFNEAARCSDIALNLSKGHYSLTPLNTTFYETAADGEPDPTPLFGYKAETESEEWMWAQQYNILAATNTHTGIYPMAPRIVNGAASTGTTQSMMDTFQCIDGLSITESGLYNWKEPWKKRDPRLELYTVRPGSRVMGIECTTDLSRPTVMDYNTMTMTTNADVSGNKSEYGINGVKGTGGYLWRKYYDPYYYGNITGAKYEDDLDCPLIRYAELLLIDAEANIEMEGGDLERAAAQINKVRDRVGMPPVKSKTRDGLRSDLRYERKVELCCEGFRWFDLRRWDRYDVARTGESDILYQALDGEQYAPPYATKQAPLPLSNARPTIDKNWVVTYDGSTWDNSAMNLRTHISLKFQEKDRLWPIPYNEMSTNELMVQNPGY